MNPIGLILGVIGFLMCAMAAWANPCRATKAGLFFSAALLGANIAICLPHWLP